LPSSGLHSNGFSLVRKVLELSGLTYQSPCPWADDTTLGKSLLTPTRIYVKTLLPAIRRGLIKGMSHITGGGFIDNIPRVLPTGLGCFVDVSVWQLPPVFQYLMRTGNVAPREMCRTFNNGVGMVLVVARADVDEAITALRESGEPVVYRIGEVMTGEGVDLRGLEAWESR